MAEPLETPAESGQASARLRHRGTNQIGVKLYNERLILSLIRREGSLPKAQIARMTGLSAQTVSVIVTALERDGLLRKEQKVRGRVGQPSVPFSLRDDGAGALGLKIGRRSAELIVVGLTGEIRGSRRTTYRFPSPEEIIAFARASSDDLVKSLPAQFARRLAGVGVAMPGEIWNWPEEMGVDAHDLEAWKGLDIGERLTAELDWPVFVANDATAACGAELTFGNQRRFADFVYVYVGAFIGGGVVLNGHPVAGRNGKAGALGSLLVTGCPFRTTPPPMKAPT